MQNETSGSDTRIAFVRALCVFGLAVLVYAVMAGDLLTKQSVAPHFVYLSDAFLNGETYLTGGLPSTYDLIRYEDRWYVAQQPLPALLMLPAVAVRGAAATPDIFITVLLGAASVTLCDFTLGVFVPDLPAWRRGLLTLFYALGTAHGWLSIMGTVWFMGQVAGTLFLWPFLLGMKWHWSFVTGLALGAVALARPSIVPGALLLCAGWWLLENRGKALAKAAVLLGVPLALCTGFLGWYNLVRFGSATNFGYDYIQEAEVLAARRLEHGNFSPAFFPENFYTATVRPPEVKDGSFEPDPWGMGLAYTSPVLVYVFFAYPWDKKRLLLAGSVIVILLPSLLYHNTGSIQFGYRFVLDALPVLMILTACGAKRGSIWWLVLGTAYSIMLHFWGIHWLYPLILGKEWIL